MRRLITLLVLGLGLGCTRPKPEEPPAASSSTRPAPRACSERLRIDLVYPGASADVLEQQVVVVVESALAPIEGIERISATSVEGRAIVWVEVSPGELYTLASEARERLGSLTSLPDGVELPMVSIVPPPGPMQVVISRGPPEALGSAVDELEHAFLATPGIASVQRRGHRAMVLSIEPDPAKLLALGIEPSTVAETLRRALQPSGAMLIRPMASIDVEGLRQIPLTMLGDTPVRLADVATLRVEPSPDGPRAWAGESAVEVLMVGSDDAQAIARVMEQTPIPSGVRHAIEGRIVPRGCSAPASGPELDGDFELLDLQLGDGARPRDAWTRDAPAADDVVWLEADPLLGDDGRPSAARAQLLIPVGSPNREALLEWLQRTPGLALQARAGLDRARVVVELRHPDTSMLEAAAARLVELAGERGLVVTSAAPASPGIEIDIRREEAARLGLSVYEISSQLRRATEGEALGLVDDGDRALPVRLASASSEDADEPGRRLSSIQLPTPSGAFVPLSAVADLRTVMQPAQLERSDLARVRYVTVWVALDARATTLRTLDEDVLPGLGLAYPDVRVQHDP